MEKLKVGMKKRSPDGPTIARAYRPIGVATTWNSEWLPNELKIHPYIIHPLQGGVQNVIIFIFVITLSIV